MLLVRADGRTERLLATGLPLGILPDAEFDTPEPIRLDTGDAFLLISHGIFETETADGGELGFDAVVETVCNHRDGSAEAMIRALRDLTESVCSCERFRDDRTVVVARRT